MTEVERCVSRALADVSELVPNLKGVELHLPTGLKLRVAAAMAKVPAAAMAESRLKRIIFVGVETRATIGRRQHLVTDEWETSTSTVWLCRPAEEFEPRTLHHEVGHSLRREVLGDFVRFARERDLAPDDRYGTGVDSTEAWDEMFADAFADYIGGGTRGSRAEFFTQRYEKGGSQ
jgi:hypothetical protein